MLKQRGLIIENEIKARKILENVSYNKLSNYWYPFLAEPKDAEIFSPEIKFEKIFKIYQFDSELRVLVFNSIEQIEVALKTQIIYHLSHADDNGYGFLNPAHYKNHERYIRTVLGFYEANHQSSLPYIDKFKRKYENPLPPAWKTLEIISFRASMNIFKNLRQRPFQEKISDHFGIHHVVLLSWLNCLVYVRNICAHHARFWNIILTIAPVWPKSPRYDWVVRWENSSTNLSTQDKQLKTYAALCLIKYLLDRVNPYNKFQTRLFSLLDQFPEVNERMIGMPPKWKMENLWQRK